MITAVQRIGYHAWLTRLRAEQLALLREEARIYRAMIAALSR